LSELCAIEPPTAPSRWDVSRKPTELYQKLSFDVLLCPDLMSRGNHFLGIIFTESRSITDYYGSETPSVAISKIE
jgi:hypothetical protein